MPAIINKVVYSGRTLIDLTSDTVAPENIFKGKTAHASDGSVITGTAEVTVSSETMNIPEGLISSV